MIKKRILINETSITIRKVFSTVLSDQEYDITFSDDSYDSLRKIATENFDAIILSVDSVPLDGYEITKIIKQNSEINDVVVVVYQTEESKMHSFWFSIIGADLFFLLDPNEIDKFVEEFKELLSGKSTFNKKEKRKLTDKDLAVLIAKSSNNELFQNTINDSLYNITMQVSNIESVVRSVFDLVEGISGVDCLAFELVNKSKVYTYYKTKSISQEEIETFLKVCESDYYKYAPENCDFKFENNCIDCEIDDVNGRKIKSYECFVLYANDFIGTFHVASCVSDIFTDVIHSRLTCFSERAGTLFETAINNLNITTNENKIRKLFSRFVPGEIIDSLIHEENTQTEFVGEKRNIAVLICDIRDFTTISENNKPENVVSFLNSYFTKMVEAIKKNGGSIDKFMGDAIMALFGAPISYEDNCDRAVKAATDMVKVIETLDLDLINLPKDKKIDIGIGIHYGEVIFGSIGCTEKSDYTVIGDSVNLASRLEGLTKQYGTKIIISSNVKNNLTQEFFMRHIDNVKVKGKSIPVSIYSVEKENVYNNEYIKSYNKAMDLYVLGGWKLAGEYFEKCLVFNPNDKAALQMVQRCKNFEINPPTNWDGAISLTTK